LNNNIDRLEERFIALTTNAEFDDVYKKFKPSKTAQNSLNFISSIDEAILQESDTCDDDVYDMVKIIYLIMGYKIEPKESCFRRLYSEIMPSHGVTNLSKIY
jgi:hypothetical protein